MICDLVIPAFNEARNVDALFDAIRPLAEGGVVRHVVLADNGSTDDTARLSEARGAIVVHEPQRGYGAACLRALARIERHDPPPDVVAFLDADLSDDPAELPRLLEPIAEGRAQVVIGSRVRRADPGALNIAQRLGGWLACTMMAVLTRRRYTDLGPFRVVTWDALCRMRMQDRTWGWTVEMQMKAALLDLPASEVDVAYRTRRAGRSKISGTVRGVIAAGTRIIATILRLWWIRRAIRREACGRAASHA